MKKISKIIVMILLIILIASISVETLAESSTPIEGGGTTSSSKTLDDIVGDANGFISQGTEQKVTDSDIRKLSNTIFPILSTIGVIVAVIGIIFLGIKYMTGAAEEQAKVKETLIPFVIGCIVVFGAFAIWSAVVNIIQNAT